jgi:diacylglycerol kinase (ATP)
VSREIALLVNPTSGKGRGARSAVPVTDRLTRAGLRVRRVQGRDAAEALDLAREAVADGVDGVVAVGGDGLVNLALQAVAGSGVPLGVVPAGTGNDFACSVGVPVGDPVAAADLVLAGHTRGVDAARAGGTWFGGVLASGFDSRVNDRANRMRWPTGKLRYDLAILAELRVFRPLPYTIELEPAGDDPASGDQPAGGDRPDRGDEPAGGRRLETEAMLVAVGNGPSYGGGMRICPQARLDDGLLDVTVVGPMSRPELVRMFPTVYRGTHLRFPQVRTYRARAVRLAAAGVTAWVDGERLAELPLTCEAVPGAVRVFVGAPT